MIRERGAGVHRPRGPESMQLPFMDPEGRGEVHQEGGASGAILRARNRKREVGRWVIREDCTFRQVNETSLAVSRSRHSATFTFSLCTVLLIRCAGPGKDSAQYRISRVTPMPWVQKSVSFMGTDGVTKPVTVPKVGERGLRAALA